MVKQSRSLRYTYRELGLCQWSLVSRSVLSCVQDILETHHEAVMALKYHSTQYNDKTAASDKAGHSLQGY